MKSFFWLEISAFELFTLNGPNWICHKVYEALSFTHFSLRLVFQDFSLDHEENEVWKKGGNYANIPFFAWTPRKIGLGMHVHIFKLSITFLKWEGSRSRELTWNFFFVPRCPAWYGPKLGSFSHPFRTYFASLAQALVLACHARDTLTSQFCARTF